MSTYIVKLTLDGSMHEHFLIHLFLWIDMIKKIVTFSIDFWCGYDHN